MRSIGRTTLVAIISATILFPTLYPMLFSLTEAATQEDSLVLTFRVAVVAFDPSHKILEGLSNETLVFTRSCGEEGIVLNISINYVYAPSWSINSLRKWLARHYSDLGKPPWINNISIAREIKWVELRSFYEYLWNLVNEVLSYYGIKSNDAVALIADIDGYSRQYYETPLAYIKTSRLVGIRGWAGHHNLTFYDLTVIPRPWPEPYVPFYGLGINTSLANEPLIWSMEKPSNYIRKLVHDHIRYHIVSVCLSSKPWYSREMSIRIIVVSYDNETTVREITSTLNASLVKNYLTSLDPWIEFDVSINLISYRDEPLFNEILRKARTEDGWIILWGEDVYSILNSITGKLFPHLHNCTETYIVNNCSYVFYILATPKPSYMRFRDTFFNFTGFSAGAIGATSYPGYMMRVLRGGINRVVAHEVGHYMGLGHPFQLDMKEIRWLMDWAETVMSYDDAVMASYRPGDVFYYDALKMAITHLQAFLAYKPRLIETVSNKLEDGDVFTAMDILVNLYNKATTSLQKTVTTVTHTSVTTILITKIVTTTITKYFTRTITVTSASKRISTTTLNTMLQSRGNICISNVNNISIVKTESLNKDYTIYSIGAVVFLLGVILGYTLCRLKRS